MTLQIADRVRIGKTWFFTRTCPPLPPAEFIRQPPIKPPRSSRNWRGYTARWFVRDGRLHLSALEPLRLRMGKPGPHVADWVDDMILELPLGEVRRDAGHRHSPVREAQLDLSIDHGVVTGWRISRGTRRRPPWREGFDWKVVRAELVAEGMLPGG